MFNLFRSGKTVALDAARHALESAENLDQVVTALRNSARVVAGADGITVVRRIGDEVEYVDEDAISPLWTGQRFPMRACISGLAMMARDVIVIPDIREDPRVPHHAYLSTFVRSMAMFPIGRDDPHMAMGTYWRQAKPADPAVIERMRGLADRATEAVERIAAAEDGRQVA